MTRFQFAIHPSDPVGRVAPALPVNVHRAQDFAIVTRSVTGRDLALAPGEYVAVVRFPDGTEVSQSFSLDREPCTVELWDAARQIEAQLETPPLGAPGWMSALPYDFIDFNPLADKVDVLREGRTFAVQKRVAGPNGDRWRYLAVAPEGEAVAHLSGPRKTFLIAVPVPERNSVTVTLELDGEGRPHPTFLMPRMAATVLYRYLSGGAVEAATRLAGSLELSALDLVAHKSEDPISGALGLYLLLNAGRLDDVGERSEKLFQYNPHLADGAVVLAEHRARQGRHHEAAEVLTHLKDRGVPVLTIGFRTALSRTSTYVRAGLEAERLSAIDRSLRFWASRALASSPTTVLELDPLYWSRVRTALYASGSV